MRANLAIKQLKELATDDRKKSNLRFFKTGPSEYGHGDQFLGVTVPDTRWVAKRFEALPSEEIIKLLQSPLHEVRLLGLLIWVKQYQKHEKQNALDSMKLIYKNYLKNIKYVNNWDLVDLSAPSIFGSYLFKNPREQKILHKLIKSKNLWERRIAIISTFYFIRKGHYQTTLILAEKLINDPEDLLHKASGWMLREVGKKDLPTLLTFLEEFAPRLPRTALRYAIEKLPAQQKKYFMNLKTQSI